MPARFSSQLAVAERPAEFLKLIFGLKQPNLGESGLMRVFNSATVNTQVEVRDTALPLAQNSADVSDLVPSEDLKSTPLNGRHWQGLLALAPGIINTGTGNASGVRFAGRAGDDNLIRTDGVDVSGNT